MAAACAVLAACGGGGSDSGGSGVSTENAQGYAADAATMPVTAGTAANAAAATLQTAVASATASAAASTLTASEKTAAEPGAATGAAQALATTATTTVPCALGGSVSWVGSGPSLALLLNRQLDAGETYDIRYDNCATAITGVVLQGTARVVVNAADPGGFDLATTASALTSRTVQGSFVLEGSWRHQLRVTATASGGTERVNRLSSALTTLTSTVGTRQARYELRNLDWTTTDQWDSANRPLSRSHSGALELFASTPRRPSATLQVATVGTLVIGSDGLATQGGFSVAAGGDKWTVSYTPSTVTLALDIGNDGIVDRTWTVQRLNFHGDAG